MLSVQKANTIFNRNTTDDMSTFISMVSETVCRLRENRPKTPNKKNKELLQGIVAFHESVIVIFFL